MPNADKWGIVNCSLRIGSLNSELTSDSISGSSLEFLVVGSKKHKDSKWWQWLQVGKDPL